jgi:undecaprenyl-diphosphatase
VTNSSHIPTFAIPIDHTPEAQVEAADNSRLWLAIAAGLVVFGDHKARRAALNGVGAIAVTSFLVNVVIKSLPRRARPDRDAYAIPVERRLPMPTSASFPSGHSASGFAFGSIAAGVARSRR